LLSTALARGHAVRKLSVLLSVFTLFTLTGVTTFADEHHHSDMAAVHGMAVLGSEKLYLSHFAMAHSPHDYQVLLEVEFDAPAKSLYLSSLKASKETVYTLVPEAFDLPDMLANPRQFQAQLFVGDNMQIVADKVSVRITRVLFSRKFEVNDPDFRAPLYILFGSETEQFMVHFIGARPNFEQIFLVKVLDAQLLSKLSSGLTTAYIAVENGDADNPVRKLGPTACTWIDENSKIQIDILAQIYLGWVGQP
jgi:hypothetical protein